MTQTSMAVQLEGESRPIATPRWLTPFGIAAFLLLIASQAYGILASPADRDMGDLEKIMYVHVPAAQNAFLCFAIVLVASIAFLWTGQERHDLIAAAAAEVGALLTALTLMLGSIWGRPTWGVWWTWDARLTSTAVLLVIFVGYLVLRAFTDDPVRRGRWSAAIGIFGALNVPIVYMSVTWWRTLHQSNSTPAAISPTYRIALDACMIASFLVVVYFIMRRYHVARRERFNEQLAEAEALSVAPVSSLEASYV